jgi:hypothetical protein
MVPMLNLKVCSTTAKIRIKVFKQAATQSIPGQVVFVQVIFNSLADRVV